MRSVVLAGLLGLSLAVGAEEGTAPESSSRPHHAPQVATVAQAIEGRVAALTRQLALTDGQQQQLRRILLEERQALLRLRTATGAAAADHAAAVHGIVERSRTAVRDLLDPEQRRRFPVEVPTDQLGPAQVDRDHWLAVARGDPGQSVPSAAPQAPATAVTSTTGHPQP